MIEKVIKLASIQQPRVANEFLQAAQELKTSPFEQDFKLDQKDILQSAENSLPKVAKELGMSIRELDSYLDMEIEKSAADMGLKGHLGRAGVEIGLSALGSVAAVALNQLYNTGKEALTEKRYYEKMMKANPDLHELPKERIKSLFKTLHSLGGGEFSSDPNVAGTFVRYNAIYGDKGIDMKGVQDIIGARSNLTKAKDVIQGPQGTPGINLLQRIQEDEKNREMAGNNKAQFDYRKDRDSIEDKRYEAKEHRDILTHGGQMDQFSRAAEKHTWDDPNSARNNSLYSLEHSKHQRETAMHNLRMALGKLDMNLKNQEQKYRYMQDPPNKP
jgi:hypothetical protein